MKIKTEKKDNSYILTVDFEALEFIRECVEERMYEEYGGDLEKVVSMGTSILEMKQLLGEREKDWFGDEK